MRVYLSSTLNDLMPERQAVRDALGGECTVVESYTADERNVRDSCLDDVAGCDLYIGILGRRYGHIPDGESHSITELEFLQAEEHGKDTLIFIKDDDEIKSKFHDAVTQENPLEKIEAFRQNIASRAAVFKSPEDLKAHVLKAFLRYSKRNAQPMPKRITGDPYPGLRAFQPDEADRFFGRDIEIDELVDRIIAHNQRFLAVIGASGSGKSSLVYAGLIPKLIESRLGTRWIPVSFSPREFGDDPFLPLAAALKNAFPAQNWHVPDIRQQLFTQPGDIVTLVEQALAMYDKETDKAAQCLLYVDQFEELFAAKVDATVRGAFFALIKAAVANSPLPQLRVVISMRSDFYSQWPQDDDSIALLRSGHFPLGVPGPASLEKMIVEPAKAVGLTISPRLVQRILDDTGTAPGALALAEFALAQLYTHRQDDTLTEDAYQAIGGVAGAINDLAEKAVESAQKETALYDETYTQLFRNIASVEQRSEDSTEALAVVRRRATQHDLS